MWSKIHKRFLKLVDDLSKHEVFLLAGSLAYTTALALAPFVIIMLSIVQIFGTSAQERLVEEMTLLLGEHAGAAVKLIVKNANGEAKMTGVSGLLGFLVLIVSASAIFSQLRVALDKINDRKETKESQGIWAFVREKFLSVGLVLGFVFLLITSLFVTTAISFLFQGSDGHLWKVISFAVTSVLFTILFTAMFRFIPSDRFSWTRCTVSGLCGTAFYSLGKALIGFYLGKSAVGSAYGTAGSLIVFLVWVYYTTLTLLVSYEFTKEIILNKRSV